MLTFNDGTPSALQPAVAVQPPAGRSLIPGIDVAAVRGTILLTLLGPAEAGRGRTHIFVLGADRA